MSRVARSVALVCCATAVAWGDTHYVATGGRHVSPFARWQDAARDIQSAVDVASVGDTASGRFPVHRQGRQRDLDGRCG